MSSQKLVTTHVMNVVDDKVEMCKCSRLSKQAAEIYSLLGMRPALFKKNENL